MCHHWVDEVLSWSRLETETVVIVTGDGDGSLFGFLLPITINKRGVLILQIHHDLQIMELGIITDLD